MFVTSKIVNNFAVANTTMYTKYTATYAMARKYLPIIQFIIMTKSMQSVPGHLFNNNFKFL